MTLKRAGYEKLIGLRKLGHLEFKSDPVLKNMQHAVCSVASRAVQPVAVACSAEPARLANYNYCRLMTRFHGLFRCVTGLQGVQKKVIPYNKWHKIKER